METEVLRQNAARVAVVFLNELLDIDTSVSDWANWDESVAWVTGRDKDFAPRNLVPQTFNTLKISAVVALDLNGRVIYEHGHDLLTNRAAPVPKPLTTYLKRLLGQHGTADYLLTRGLILADPDPLLVATRPIRSTDGRGPDRGVLLFARKLDAAKTAEWGDFASLQLEVHRLDDPGLPLDCRQAWGMMSERDQLAVRPISENRIAGYALLKDIEQAPAVILRGVQSRPINAKGHQVVTYLGFMVAIAVLFFSLVMLMLIERAVLSRLARLNADVAQIGATGDLNARVSVGGQDELSQLADALNGMLDAVRRSQNERAESDLRYRSVITQTSEGILLVDAASMGLLEANPALLQLVGYEHEELAGVTLDTLLGDAAEQIRGYLTTVAPEGDHVVEVRFGRRDGRWVEAEVKANRISYGGREAICAVVRDVTGRRDAEEERRVFEQQMLHAQKLESLGVLAGGIAHDFNNLLTGIMGNAALALHHLPPDSPVLTYLERIETTSSRAAELIAQLLAYAGKGQFLVTPLDLAELVTEMADLLNVSVSKLALLEVFSDDDLPLILGDATQLRQVIMNLLTNASDALGARAGHIVVRTSVKSVDRDELLRAHSFDRLPEGQYVSLLVQDDGAGMDEATVARIFDPFFTTKFTGRGLGLAAVLGIVRAHRGAILVTSQLGRGTTVEVLLPVAPRGTDAAARPTDAWTEVGDWGHGRTVLVVDDEHDVAQVAQAVLQQAGCEVVIAEDGVEALSQLRRREGEVDVVLLDLTMPGMSGAEVLAEVHRLWPSLPVVMSSGYPQPIGGDGGTLAGLSGFVQKPYQPVTLLRHLAEACANAGRAQ
ncbi:MAG: response regulator [Armatimonadetes bacterium]|nr:response regulator [Armatimonadota bacterium]